jgi:hypothetical protein
MLHFQKSSIISVEFKTVLEKSSIMDIWGLEIDDRHHLH